VIVPAGDDALTQAAGVLRAGGLVIIPTDTVYGIAVDATVAGAADALFAAKGRPRSVPIAVLVSDEEAAWAVAASPVPSEARRLAARWWPGALTLIVHRGGDWPADLGDDGGTVGLRCPDDAWARALCRATGPLATTSANLHGAPTAAEPAELAAQFEGVVAVVVDGGRREGRASSVVDCTEVPPRLVREGALGPRDLWTRAD
jgi:L-threonylcarbamoyladenylate synthase